MKYHNGVYLNRAQNVYSVLSMSRIIMFLLNFVTYTIEKTQQMKYVINRFT
jgi:hypothetical protein